MVNQFHNRVDWHAYYQEIARPDFDPEIYEDGETVVMYLEGQRLTLEMQSNGEFEVIDVEEMDYGTNR